MILSENKIHGTSGPQTDPFRIISLSLLVLRFTGDSIGKI